MRRVYASSLENARKCPAFTWQEGDSTAAERGTNIHKALETFTTENLVTEDIAPYEYGVSVYEDLVSMEPDKVEAEVAFPLPRIGNCKMDVFATFTDTRTIVVIDWKTGRTFHDAVTDLQGKAYALVLFTKLPGIDRVIMTFSHLDLQSDSTWTFLRSDLEDLEAEVYSAYYAAVRMEPEEKPGDLCGFCAKKLTCRARTNEVNTALVASKVDLPDITTVADWTPELRGDFLDRLGKAEKFLDQLKKTIRGDALLPTPVVPAGYEVDAKRGSRKVNDAFFAAETLREVGIPEPIITANTTMSLGNLEKAYVDAKRREIEASLGSLPRGFVKATTEEFYEMLRDRGLISREADVQYLKKSKRINKEIG